MTVHDTFIFVSVIVLGFMAICCIAFATYTAIKFISPMFKQTVKDMGIMTDELTRVRRLLLKLSNEGEDEDLQDFALIGRMVLRDEPDLDDRKLQFINENMVRFLYKRCKEQYNMEQKAISFEMFWQRYVDRNLIEVHYD